MKYAIHGLGLGLALKALNIIQNLKKMKTLLQKMKSNFLQNNQIFQPGNFHTSNLNRIGTILRRVLFPGERKREKERERQGGRERESRGFSSESG